MIKIDLKSYEELINDSRIKYQNIDLTKYNFKDKINFGTKEKPFLISLEELYRISKGSRVIYDDIMHKYLYQIGGQKFSYLLELLLVDFCPYVRRLRNRKGEYQYYIIEDYSGNIEVTENKFYLQYEMEINGKTVTKELDLISLDLLEDAKKYIMLDMLKLSGDTLSQELEDFILDFNKINNGK